LEEKIMNRSRLFASFIAAGVLIFAGCSKKTDNQQTAASQPVPAGQQPAAQQPPATTPTQAAPSTAGSPAATAPSAGQPSGAPAAATTAQNEPPRAAPAPPPPPKPATFVIPDGASIGVRTTSTLSTKTAQPGDRFEGSLAAPIVVNGVVIARRGAAVSGRVVSSDPGGRVKGRASISIAVNSIRTVDGQTIPVESSAFAQEAASTKKKDALKIGGGAALGALIGGLAGGGKGAAIGAGAGGAAGTGLVVGTRGDAAVIPAETVMRLRLTAPARVTEREPGSLAKKTASSDDSQQQ
jgi:hypothetical protein